MAYPFRAVLDDKLKLSNIIFVFRMTGKAGCRSPIMGIERSEQNTNRWLTNLCTSIGVSGDNEPNEEENVWSTGLQNVV